MSPTLLWGPPRSWVGILLPPEADPSLGKALAEKGYKEHDVPAAAARVAYFPFKGFLSIIVGVIKVCERVPSSMPAAGTCNHLILMQGIRGGAADARASSA